jgi:hypothetical protein
MTEISPKNVLYEKRVLQEKLMESHVAISHLLHYCAASKIDAKIWLLS